MSSISARKVSIRVKGFLINDCLESVPIVSHMNNLPEKSLRFHANFILNASEFLFCNSFTPTVPMQVCTTSVPLQTYLNNTV